MTGADGEGQPIARSGGFGGRMRFLGCADCHGEDGGGRRVTMMMFDFTAPDIRWETLSATDAEDGHEDDAHPPYDRESFSQALREGVNPAGERLDRVMPRWQVSDGTGGSARRPPPGTL